MRVYLPHHEAAPQPWTAMWARHYYPQAEWVKVQPGGDHYARKIAELWLRGEPFIIVEHDVVPWPGAVEKLAECPEPWCAYEVYPGTDYEAVRYGSIGLSCIKVDPARLGSPPFKFEETDVPWPATDSVFSQVLFERGHMVHQHWPSVCNLNGDYPNDPQPLRERPSTRS